MAQISIQNLTFNYPNSSDNIFENVSINIDTDWKLGLIGRNGRGKTTLFKILQGKLEYSGKIACNVNFDYFPFTIEDKEKLSIDILYEIYPECELWNVMKKMQELELDDECLHKPFCLLSNGEQTKLLLALLFTKENNFLLIDEPTNHLDQNSRNCIKNFLNKQKGFIVVSHDRDFIDSCVSHILSINKNSIEIQKGNFSSFWLNKQNEDERELKQNEKLKKEISRLKESALTTKEWSNKVEKSKNGTRDSGLKVDKGYVGHKAAKMMQRSKNIENRKNKQIEEKSKLLKNIETSDNLFIASNVTSTHPLIEMKDVSIFYSNNCILKNFNLSICPGQKIALQGKNGCGKTSVLKLLVNENITYTGKVYIKSGIRISYLSQTNYNLDVSLSDFADNHKLDKTEFFTFLIKLGFTRSELENSTQNLSAGQKRKILIAKSLCQKCDLYIWDEPLNYIDIYSRIQIENLIKQSNITLLFVEHDSAFTNSIATDIVSLS